MIRLLGRLPAAVIAGGADCRRNVHVHHHSFHSSTSLLRSYKKACTSNRRRHSNRVNECNGNLSTVGQLAMATLCGGWKRAAIYWLDSTCAYPGSSAELPCLPPMEGSFASTIQLHLYLCISSISSRPEFCWSSPKCPHRAKLRSRVSAAAQHRSGQRIRNRQRF